MTKYHPALVALHWVMAIMIVMALIFGNFLVGPTSSADPAKAEILVGHMSVGLILGSLLVIRLILRLRTAQPPHATTGNAALDTLGRLTHWVLYGFVALMILSGLGMAFGAGLFPIVFGGSGDPIPEGLSDMAFAMIHDLVSNLLLLLLLLHVAAALYHQFYLRDGLFRRIWFGKRS